ncbi:MAG: DUF4399 domain-containing protein [Acidobacteria bacterium]|nr:DUF4399 domain-containing protein [Acidobacteriota bacterium]
MRTTIARTAVLVLMPLLMAACGQPAPAGPRVFFVQPQDGATVKSPVRLEFGAENFQIAAVPAGTVTESRPNMGHHHVGVDADCLPPGTAIPRAAPWVHFGDGKNVIEMQLPAGQHRLTLQIGDDMHRTQPDLCATISVNVTE